MSAEQVRAEIIDLCSDDSYGSWEVWWAVRGDLAPAYHGGLREVFVPDYADCGDSALN